MARNKYYIHYIREFRDETRRFDFEEKGIYITLIDEYFESECKPIDNNLNYICELISAKPTKKIKEKIRKVLDVKFRETGEGYIHDEVLKRFMRAQLMASRRKC